MRDNGVSLTGRRCSCLSYQTPRVRLIVVAFCLTESQRTCFVRFLGCIMGLEAHRRRYLLLCYSVAFSYIKKLLWSAFFPSRHFYFFLTLVLPIACSPPPQPSPPSFAFDVDELRDSFLGQNYNSCWGGICRNKNVDSFMWWNKFCKRWFLFCLPGGLAEVWFQHYKSLGSRANPSSPGSHPSSIALSFGLVWTDFYTPPTPKTKSASPLPIWTPFPATHLLFC